MSHSIFGAIVITVFAIVVGVTYAMISAAQCQEGFKADTKPQISLFDPSTLLGVMNQATKVTKYIFDDSIWKESFATAGMNPMEVARRQILIDRAAEAAEAADNDAN